MSTIVTLTQVQEDAIAYLHRSKRPNAHKVKRKANRMVREFCQRRGYSEMDTAQCVRDMIDVYELERDAR
jgi:hypothetical protein